MINYLEGYTGIHRKLSYTLSQNGLLGLNVTVNRKNQQEYNILNKQQSLRDVRKIDHAHDKIFSGYGWTWINSRGYHSVIESKKPKAKNLTSSLGARGPLIDNGMHATAIDVSSFWHQL